MATHLVARGRSLCDRALVLDAGRLIYGGPVSGMPASHSDEAGLAEGS
jgi:ABC-type uncharacterized transport system ATPase subunit